jgi:hypothetical protein
MDNHTHLLIQIGSIPISKVMHNLNSQYARYFNKKYEKIGHLFQGRYKAQYVNSRDYLVKLVRYIHMNPVKANMVTDVSDYSWSSHAAYLQDNQQSWLSTQWVLLHFNSDLSKARLKYYAYMQEMVGETFNSELLAEIDALNIKDSKNFVRSPENLKQDPREGKVSFDSIVAFCCQYYRLDYGKLIGPSSAEVYVYCRVTIAWLSQYFQVTTICAVAAYFNKNACSFGRCKNRFEKRNVEKLLQIKEEYLSCLEA